MKPRVGILGVGWLGFPLGKSLVKLGYPVSGSTTNKANLELIANEGIDSYYISLFEEGVRGSLIDFLKEIDILLINVPPNRSTDDDSYLKKMRQLYEAVKIMHVEKIIFVSSTSVYGSLSGEVTEKSVPKPNTPSGKQLLAAENLFKKDTSLSTTIVRFGGLIGPDRHPVTFLSGRKNIKNGDDVINLIHLEDCMYLLTAIISNSWWNEIFNGVYPYHPSKKEYYTAEAKKRGLPIPEYLATYPGKSGKLIKGDAFVAKKMQFKTPLVSE
ncbi:MAG: SDR family oxidoreductase [Arenibacter sp.]|nr:SDR family oxidoreductase [Eudoraea sp.]NNG11368.1 SDR family oxidoreductase [Arenibacter sp.]